MRGYSIYCTTLETHHEHNVPDKIMIPIDTLLLLLPPFLLSFSPCGVFAVIVFVRHIFLVDFNFHRGGNWCLALPFQGLGGQDMIGVNNLFQYLSLAEVPANPHRARCAKRAPHRAANLRRNAERGAAALRAVMAHDDCFHNVAILQLDGQLGGSAVAAETALDDGGREGDEAVVGIGKECQQCLGKEMDVLLGGSRRDSIGERPMVLIHGDTVSVGATLPGETNLVTPFVRSNELVERRIVLTVQQLIELVDALWLQLNASFGKRLF